MATRYRLIPSNDGGYLLERTNKEGEFKHTGYRLSTQEKGKELIKIYMELDDNL